MACSPLFNLVPAFPFNHISGHPPPGTPSSCHTCPPALCSVSTGQAAPGRLLVQLLCAGSLHPTSLPLQADSFLLLLQVSLKGSRSARGSPWPSSTPEPREVFCIALAHYCSYTVSSLSVCFMPAARRETGSPILSSLCTLTALAVSSTRGFKHHHPIDSSQMQIHIPTPDSSPKLKLLTFHFLLGRWPRYT